MKVKMLVPKRYQLDRESVRIALRGHPWIFRDHLSSAVKTFQNGQWMALYDGSNQLVGYGIYDTAGAIGIRMLKLGKNLPDPKFFEKTIEKALAKRAHVEKYTNAVRLIHGENDELPGIVVDKYDDVLVLQTYSETVDTLGRWVVGYLSKKLQVSNVIWKFPAKRKRTEASRKLRWSRKDSVVTIREGSWNWTVNLWEGQKSGAFLDLRGLRKWLLLQKWKPESRMLNLFSYTGSLGSAAFRSGVNAVWNVDISEDALSLGKSLLTREQVRNSKWITADVFEWIANLSEQEKFELVVVDPPQMASLMTQVPKALKVYEKLYAKSKKHVDVRGKLVAACCTSRITRKDFSKVLKSTLGDSFKLIKDLSSEDDHPVRFSEGDYLKIMIFERVR